MLLISHTYTPGRSAESCRPRGRASPAMQCPFGPRRLSSTQERDSHSPTGGRATVLTTEEGTPGQCTGAYSAPELHLESAPGSLASEAPRALLDPAPLAPQSKTWLPEVALAKRDLATRKARPRESRVHPLNERSLASLGLAKSVSLATLVGRRRSRPRPTRHTRWPGV